jgi:hypothetical protein
MQLPYNSVQEFKELFKKEYGVEYDDATAREAAQNLIGLFEVLMSIDLREQKWNRRLEESPNGFAVPNEKGYPCWLCKNTRCEWEYWFDKYELKCPPCQRAVNDGVVPGNIIRNNDTWCSMDDVRTELNLHHSTIKKMIRTGELQARIIRNDEHDYFWVFLKEKNDLLDNHEENDSYDAKYQVPKTK